MRPFIMKTEKRRKNPNTGAPVTNRKPQPVDEWLQTINFNAEFDDPLKDVPPEEIEEVEVVDISAMLSDGWELRDITWIAIDDWNKVIEVMKGSSFMMLSGSSRFTEGVEWRRGYFLMSPETLEQLRVWANKMLEEHAKNDG